MYTKAIDLKEFYDSTQGRVVQRILRQHLRRLWPETAGLRVLGLGYAVPYLAPFTAEAERVTALMPARQGAVFWPAEDKGLVCMCDEGALPVESNSVDRILVVHACQDFDGMDAILSESWRVLTGQGRLVLVVPNRSGIWARFDNTPFGHGAPWSLGQLRHLLKEYMFVPENAERALFFPPASSRLMLAAAPVWEKAGQKFFNAFGGVNIVEASKQLYAGIPATEPAAARKRRFPATALPVPERHRF